MKLGNCVKEVISIEANSDLRMGYLDVLMMNQSSGDYSIYLIIHSVIYNGVRTRYIDKSNKSTK